MGGPDKGLVERAERTGRRTAVLVARITGNVKPSDGGARLQCLDALIQAAELSGGRVVRKQNDAVIVLLSTSDAAAAAAARMQAYIASAGNKCQDLGVRIGFETGRVTQDRHDVLGDTVNLALDFSREARKGQIITSEASASSLRASNSAQQVAGNGLHEIRWREASAQILGALKETFRKGERLALRLEYAGKVLVRRREFEYISFGRDPKSDVFVPGELASRQHCTVTRQERGFVLRDHSTNGTFVMVAGEGELHIHADDFLLGKSGWISLGESGDTSVDVIQYQLLAGA